MLNVDLFMFEDKTRLLIVDSKYEIWNRILNQVYKGDLFTIYILEYLHITIDLLLWQALLSISHSDDLSLEASILNQDENWCVGSFLEGEFYLFQKLGMLIITKHRFLNNIFYHSMFFNLHMYLTPFSCS